MDLDSGHVLTIFQNCDTVDLDSHQDFRHFFIFSELRYCGAALTVNFPHLKGLEGSAAAREAWVAWVAWVAWTACAA